MDHSTPALAPRVGSAHVKYRHAHHAGNFADAVKHLVLVGLLAALERKDSPFLYLETHAGRGRYALPPPAERQDSEYAEGAGRLLALPERPATLATYLQIVERLGTDATGTLRHYPGSPLIAATLLREADRAVLFEARAEEATALRLNLAGHANALVYHGDGYAALRAKLPPRERRGLVLIDPPYERQESEFDLVLGALREGIERWATGIYAIWYPIKRRAPVRDFHERLVQLGVRRILCAELCLYPDDSRVSLNGCGMIIVNPPWQTDVALQRALPDLHRALGARPGTSARCFWLVPE